MQAAEWVGGPGALGDSRGRVCLWAAGGQAWECVTQPSPHCTLLSYCTEKVFLYLQCLL